jgi:NAD(P)-dependent dehydrogenase (short-subunit alcohol dehydrogenase family)
MSRTVLITGAASGLGLAMAERFAAEHYSVVGLDLDGAAVHQAMERLAAASGVRTLALAASVADEQAVEDAFSKAWAEAGPIHVVINNAGLSCNKPSLDLSLAEWQRAMDVNLTGVFLCARAAGRRMQDHGGAIINMSSMYGVVAAPDRAAYCATKSGVAMLTRVLAIEWAAMGIRVNAIAPGYVRTQLLEDLIGQGRVDADALARRTPLGRLGTPAEIADMALFLASGNASFVTGQVVGVDGGWSAYGYI